MSRYKPLLETLRRYNIHLEKEEIERELSLRREARKKKVLIDQDFFLQDVDLPTPTAFNIKEEEITPLFQTNP